MFAKPIENWGSSFSRTNTRACGRSLWCTQTRCFCANQKQFSALEYVARAPMFFADDSQTTHQQRVRVYQQALMHPDGTQTITSGSSASGTIGSRPAAALYRRSPKRMEVPAPAKLPNPLFLILLRRFTPRASRLMSIKPRVTCYRRSPRASGRICTVLAEFRKGRDFRRAARPTAPTDCAADLPRCADALTATPAQRQRATNASCSDLKV
jgi:hypothetical protein